MAMSSLERLETLLIVYKVRRREAYKTLRESTPFSLKCYHSGMGAAYDNIIISINQTIAEMKREKKG